MKKINLKYLFLFVGFISVSFLFHSCKEKDDWGKDFEQNTQAPKITRVFLEDANSSVPDRLVEFARLGQIIRLEGENLLGVTKVIINGYSCYFNQVLSSNVSLIVQVDRNVPTIEAAENVRNTIRLEKGQHTCIFDFPIRAGLPSITKISHTMPLAGEWITVEGKGLVEISKVVFPGNIEVTSDIVQDEDGNFFKVKVPAGVSENGGSIFVESANGGAYSPAYFNCKTGIILDFDGHGEQASWEDNHVKSTDLLADVIGQGNVSQGNYAPMIPVRMASVNAGTPRATAIWTTGNEDWRSLYVPALFSTGTSIEEIAFQFDIYVPDNWNNTGFIGVNIANDFSAGNQWTGAYYNYIPWLDGSTKVPFKTEGWTTVTIPLNKIYRFSDKAYTFEDILAFREAASYKNFGLCLHDNDFTLKDITRKEADEAVAFPSANTSVKIYVDNLRLVSLATPAYSDFPDEE